MRSYCVLFSSRLEVSPVGSLPNKHRWIDAGVGKYASVELPLIRRRNMMKRRKLCSTATLRKAEREHHLQGAVSRTERAAGLWSGVEPTTRSGRVRRDLVCTEQMP